MKFSFIVLIVLYLYSCTGCSSTDPVPVETPFELESSIPEKQGLDPEMLSIALEEAGQLNFLNCILILKNSYIVSENYFRGFSQEDPVLIASCTKSIMSALFGLALRENYLESLDLKIADFFPEYFSLETDPDKYEITIRHLLQMRSGYKYDLEDNFWFEWDASENKIQFVIEYPLSSIPSASFAYSSPAAHILSGILTRAAGMSTLEFANRYLCGPLNITIHRWWQDEQGYYLGEGGIFLTPRDMLKFGYLYLQRGIIGNREILSPGWIDTSIHSWSDDIDWIGDFPVNIGYGYLWWTGKFNDTASYFAWGHGGQLILVLPGLDMVIVTTAETNVSPARGEYQVNEIIRIINEYILPAVEGII